MLEREVHKLRRANKILPRSVGFSSHKR